MTHLALFHKLADNPHDRKLFRQFILRYDQHIRRVVYRRFATSRLEPGIREEDIVQEVYITLLENNGRVLRSLKYNNAAFSYLGIIAYTTLLRFKDSRGYINYDSLSEKILEDLLGSRQIDHSDINKEISDCLGKIAQSRRHGNRDVAIYKLKLDGVAVANIAHHFKDLSEQRVADICGEIKKEMQKCLRKKGIGPPRRSE